MENSDEYKEIANALEGLDNAFRVLDEQEQEMRNQRVDLLKRYEQTKAWAQSGLSHEELEDLDTGYDFGLAE